MPDVSVEADIPATPDELYALVSDVTRMGEWSPETTACRWIGGASGPAVGARFRGANRDGWRRWSTACKVVTAEPGRRFGFDVALGPFPVAHWEYEFEPTSTGTHVTERWTDRRQGWMVKVSPAAMGVPDREAHNREGMEQTLARLRDFAEARPAS